MCDIRTYTTIGVVILKLFGFLLSYLKKKKLYIVKIISVILYYCTITHYISVTRVWT